MSFVFTGNCAIFGAGPLMCSPTAIVTAAKWAYVCLLYYTILKCYIFIFSQNAIWSVFCACIWLSILSLYIFEDVLENISYTGRYLIFMVMQYSLLVWFYRWVCSGMISMEAPSKPLKTLGFRTKQCSFHCSGF